MKNIKRIVSIILAVLLLVSSSFASGFVADNAGSYWVNSNTNAFDTNSFIPGVPAYQFIRSSYGCAKGNMYGKECLQLCCDGAFVEFNTAQAHEFAFSSDQEYYDYDNSYSLEVYVNGVFQYSFSDFDSPDYNPYDEHIACYPNGTVRIVARSWALNPSGSGKFEPIYLTNCVLN